MHSFKSFICSKKISRTSSSFFIISLAVISLILVTPVMSQKILNINDNGHDALQFDGQDDYLSIGVGINLENSSMTLEAWAKRSAPGTLDIIWGQGSNWINHGLNCGFFEDDVFKFTFSGNDLVSHNIYTDYDWHHWACTFDASTKARKIYRDGLEIAYDLASSNYQGNGTYYPFYIGSTSWFSGYFYGILDELRIWNKARTLQEIRANMYTHLASTDENLVGYWPLNEGTGGVVNDLSGNNNHGIIYGANWVGYGAPIGTIIIFCTPTYGYLNNNLFTSLHGTNTHFLHDLGTSNVWLSNNDIKIYATQFQVHSNTLLDAEFFIPLDVPDGYWNMNIETSIDSVITMQNAIEIIVEGNYALQFDGINDNVIIPDHDSLDMVNSSVSISVWVKSSVSYNEGRIIISHDIWDNPGTYQLESMDSNNLRFSFPGMGSDEGEFDYTVNFTDGKWHHIVGMLDSDNNETRLYYDGLLAVKKTVTNEIGSATALTYIGSGGEGESFFSGLIDEVRIWNKALTLEEIRINTYNHLSSTEEGLVGYWPFDEGAGGVVYDLSGNHNHGTVYGATWVGSGAPIGKLIIYCDLHYGYQNHNVFTSIQGANTHFRDGIKQIWLSKNSRTIHAHRYTPYSNTLVDAKFYIPPDASLGQWNLHVETIVDSIITSPLGIEILPPPSVTPQNGHTSSWLKSVYAIDDQACWSVGNDGKIQKTKDGGITWEAQNSGTSDVLNSVFFIDNEVGWTVGQYGTILKTTNGGAEWTMQTSGTSNNLQSVYFVNAQIGWAVGRLGTILKTTDGGLNWYPQNSGTSSWLYAVCFTNEENGWAVGSAGTILKTTDGGMTWELQNSGTTDYLSSVHFFDSDSGWTVGSNGAILKTTDGGNDWIVQNSGTTEWLKTVFFRNAHTGWIVGTNGVLITTADGGDNWYTGRSFTNRTLNALHFADENTGWAVGECGTILNLTMSNLATAIEDNREVSSVPQEFRLYQNYPNPFNPVTRISFVIPQPGAVLLHVYNTLGQKVASLIEQPLPAGFHEVIFDALDLPSGLYFYRIRAGEFFRVRKMIVLR